MLRRSKEARLRALIGQGKALLQEREVQAAMAQWSRDEWHTWTNAVNVLVLVTYRVGQQRKAEDDEETA